jgi:peptide/nickel transport system permease protein
MTANTDVDATGTASPVDLPAGRSQPATRGRLVLRRFLRNKLAIFGLAVLVLLYVAAFGYPLFAPWSYTDIDSFNALVPPTTSHWFGTDQIGTDVFALTMRGLQKSLLIGLLVGLFSTALAAMVGAASGYFGRWADRALMWVVDLLLILPSFLVVAIMSPLFKGQSWVLFVVVLALFQWMITARIVRGMTLTLREREFVKAARYMGQPPWRIIAKHILPNMASLLIIDMTVNVGVAILAESSLSYFGFGVQPPDVSLGTLIAKYTESAQTFPWVFYFPASFLVITVLAVNFAGDGLRDALDPTSARGRKKETKRRRKATHGGRANR